MRKFYGTTRSDKHDAMSNKEHHTKNKMTKNLFSSSERQRSRQLEDRYMFDFQHTGREHSADFPF